MSTPIDSQTAWILLGLYGLFMTLLVWLGTKPDRSAEQHLVAGRQVSVWRGAFSIAATWIWAPAIFVCSMKSYQQGLAGIFWFTVPNVLCFLTFVPVAIRARQMMPKSYSLPEFVAFRFNGDSRCHMVFLFIVMSTSVLGIVSNSLAGGVLLHNLAGVDQNLTIIAFAGIALFYSVWRGLPASVITDTIQISIILFIAVVIVPWTLSTVGVEAINNGVDGIEGSIGIFDPWIAYSFGIPATIGLLSGPICDQMFYQRAMATKPESIKPTFIYGGLIFAIVPIVLSLLGFIAADPTVNSVLGAGDPQLIGVRVVQAYLPKWTLLGFSLMALCALSSTLDSAYCAAGALFSVDVYKRYFNARATETQLLSASKLGMLLIGVLGTAIALIPGVKLLYIFLIYGVLGAAGVSPVLLALFTRRVTANGIFYGAVIALVTGLPLSIYANVTESPHLIVLSSAGTVLLGLLVTSLVSMGRATDYEINLQPPQNQDAKPNRIAMSGY